MTPPILPPPRSPMASQPEVPCDVHEMRLDRCDKRIEMIEAGEKDHEHRITVMETRGGDRTSTLRAWGPTILMAIFAAWNLFLQLRKHP